MSHPNQGSLFRSEEMTLLQFYIPYEIAQVTVAELGELGCVEFRDLNGEVNAFQRAFVNEIRRLDEMERKLRFLQTQLTRSNIKSRPLTVSQSYARTRSQQEIDELEARLNDLDSKIHQMNHSQEALNKRYLELTELRHVLRETAAFFEEAEQRQEDLDGNNGAYTRVDGAPLLQDMLMDAEAGEGNGPEAGAGAGVGFLRNANLGFVAGVIPRLRMSSFERVLWRALRGNLYMNYAEIDEPIHDPVTDEVVQKNVFIIFAHGKEILSKIRKISESMGATLYPVDDRPDKRREDALEVIARIEDLNNVLYNTQQTRRAELLKVAESVEVWDTIIKKEKAIYFVMNMFNYDLNRKCLIGEGWAPKRDLPAIQYSLRGVTERTGSTIPPLLNELRTTKQPPTFHRLNKFTKGFQEIVDSYGVAKYQEVNPGLYTIITFPFLFAVMFGDFGHGLIATMFAAWMVLNEKKLEKKNWGEIWHMFYGGRYIILLMSVFSIYTGLIYNDIFSRAVNFFGNSSYTFTERQGDKWKGTFSGSPYPFGLDPVWHKSENMLIFTNSYKMKMSVIFGVLQMSFGICLTVFNYRHFNKKYSIIHEFVPQMLFMQSIFGYLALMILYKWCTNWFAINRNPPSLLAMLINMFLKPGTIPDGEELYAGQSAVQVILILIAVVCIPWMLLGKPLHLKREMQKYAQFHNLSHGENIHTHSDDASPPGSPDSHSSGAGHVTQGATGPSNAAAAGAGHDEHHDFSEIMIHQVIHSIEFCLGCISNTASYLRLWALSLAHAQLSEVLWDMVLEKVIHLEDMTPFTKGIFLFIAFAIWFSLTIGILLLMEGLSAFLHALRLHWVEFNNKFYEGSGKKFEPFDFARVLAGDAEE